MKLVNLVALKLVNPGMRGIRDTTGITGPGGDGAGRAAARGGGTGRLAALAIAVAAVAALAACGSGHTVSGGQGTPAATSSAGPARPAVSLVITLTARPGAKPVTWTLQCDPSGGTHPDAAAACRALAAAKNPFAPVPKGMMCPMIVGGPATAKIAGTWHDVNINAVFSQANGCQASRWRKIGPVFDTSAGASGSRAPQE
jgi:Subtilisin inhibitor-like